MADLRGFREVPLWEYPQNDFGQCDSCHRAEDLGPATVLTMAASSRETEILHQAIHVIHRANFVYWRTKKPSREARAEYHRRQERLDAIRIMLVTVECHENHIGSVLGVAK